MTASAPSTSRAQGPALRPSQGTTPGAWPRPLDSTTTSWPRWPRSRASTWPSWPVPPGSTIFIYRYFPSKRAVVLALYDELSAQYAARAAQMRPGRWRERFLHALRASLEVLRPHRDTLASLVPILVGDANEGLFAPSTAFSRIRVQGVFV